MIKHDAFKSILDITNARNNQETIWRKEIITKIRKTIQSQTNTAPRWKVIIIKTKFQTRFTLFQASLILGSVPVVVINANVAVKLAITRQCHTALFINYVIKLYISRRSPRIDFTIRVMRIFGAPDVSMRTGKIRTGNTSRRNWSRSSRRNVSSRQMMIQSIGQADVVHRGDNDEINL